MVHINWRKRTKELPMDAERKVLAYSPIYEDRNEAMVLRIIDSRFVSISEEIQYWVYADEIKPQLND